MDYSTPGPKFIPRGTYDGAELRRNPGLPDERFEAFALPSLRNGERVPYHGIRPQLTSELKDKTNNGR